MSGSTLYEVKHTLNRSSLFHVVGAAADSRGERGTRS